MKSCLQKHLIDCPFKKWIQMVEF
uniref:Uncharacterized protein n=1 Tax=Anguilla anguilla TaxID=7936 RepID=A0A0E9P8F8_ANGAN